MEFASIEKQVKIKVPTDYTTYWGSNNTEKNYSYSTVCPQHNKLNSTLNCWIQDIDGDSEYKEMVLEISNPQLVEVHERKEFKDLLLKGVGEVDIIIYPKYNPKNKLKFHIFIE